MNCRMVGKGTPRTGLVLAALLLWACSGDTEIGPRPEEAPISARAEAYLNWVLDIMQTNSINR